MARPSSAFAVAVVMMGCMAGASSVEALQAPVDPVVEWQTHPSDAVQPGQVLFFDGSGCVRGGAPAQFADLTLRSPTGETATFGSHVAVIGDLAGSFRSQLEIPLTFAPTPGAVVSIACRRGDETYGHDERPLPVLDEPLPTLVAPGSARAGDRITISGTSCALRGVPLQYVSVAAQMPGALIGYSSERQLVQTDGSWTQEIQLPPDAAPGRYTINGSCYGPGNHEQLVVPSAQVDVRSEAGPPGGSLLVVPGFVPGDMSLVDSELFAGNASRLVWRVNDLSACHGGRELEIGVHRTEVADSPVTYRSFTVVCDGASSSQFEQRNASWTSGGFGYIARASEPVTQAEFEQFLASLRTTDRDSWVALARAATRTRFEPPVEPPLGGDRPGAERGPAPRTDGQINELARTGGTTLPAVGGSLLVALGLLVLVATARIRRAP